MTTKTSACWTSSPMSALDVAKNNWLQKFSKFLRKYPGWSFLVGYMPTEYVSMSSCLKIFWEKSQWLTSVLIKLRPCNTKPGILSKNGAHFKPFCRSTENSNVFTRKPPRWKLLFSNVAGQEFISDIWLKKGLHHKDIWEISLPNIF